MKELMALVARRTLPAMAACLVPALLVFADIRIFGRCEEEGIIEISQAAILLLISLALGFAAHKRSDLKGGLILASGFFLTMFIRENDQLLDQIQHGIWLYPALLVTAIAIWRAWRVKATILPSIRRICSDCSYPLFAIGFFVTIAFSRIFGMKPIWQAVVGMDDYRPAKHVAEEGGELLGYAIMLTWAVCLIWTLLKEHRTEASGPQNAE